MTVVNKKARKQLIGNRKDSMTVVPQDNTAMTTPTPTTTSFPATEKLQQRIKPREQPKHHDIVILRFPGLPHRTKISAAQWRTLLKQDVGVSVHTVLFPSGTTVEIVAEKKDEGTIKQYFTMWRTASENPDPYHRRDGKTTRLGDDILMRIALSRIQMLKHERSVIGVNWLKQSISAVLPSLEQSLQGKLQQELDKVMEGKVPKKKQTVESDPITVE